MGPLGSKRYVNVVCFDMQLDSGEEGKSPFINLSLRIVDGDDTGRNIYKRCYLSPAAQEISFKQLRALGWTGTKLSKAMSEGLGTRKANALLIVKKLESGKIVEDVKGIYEPKARASATAVDASSLDAFDALFEDAASVVSAETELTEANKAPALPPAVTSGNGAAKPTADINDQLGF